ncbi:MAG: response regulator [Magnetococcales bacterium]|nr:response regulator [Magnetococcales bacterium]
MTHILVVDDDEEVCLLLTAILSNHGYDVASAMDGREAFRRLMQESFDLVITDIFMPEMDGFRLIHSLREQAVQVLAISAGFHEFTAGVTLRMAGALGAVTLGKPIRANQLLEQVETMLRLPETVAHRRKMAWGV